MIFPAIKIYRFSHLLMAGVKDVSCISWMPVYLPVWCWDSDDLLPAACRELLGLVTW